MQESTTVRSQLSTRKEVYPRLQRNIGSCATDSVNITLNLLPNPVWQLSSDIGQVFGNHGSDSDDWPP